MTTETEKKNAFLKELTELSNRHGFHIWGCGCCTSPTLDANEGSGSYKLHETAFKSAGPEVEWVNDPKVES